VLRAVAGALPAHAIAVFDVEAEDGRPNENSIVLVAPSIPTDADLLERASAITVAPFLPEIVRRRRPVPRDGAA
jgi:hypothetical protein